MLTPSALSVAYSRAAPSTVPSRVWLVMATPTSSTMPPRNSTPEPAPVSNIQNRMLRRAKSSALQASTRGRVTALSIACATACGSAPGRSLATM
ncbi:hypothetical protein NB689_003409 [Xanthomonas sacchari]|nr:hypothetical protein [Xanthomonas sacchari]MCW0450696.1 hypothetical protein [Xanthomonas sacchari]